jgi:hypothetical protein
MRDTPVSKRLWLSLGVILACASCVSKPEAPVSKPPAGKPYPVPSDENFINNAYAHPDVWNGSGVATRARVRLVRLTPNHKAILELEVQSPATAIWAVWFTEWKDDFLAEGDTVRVAGWLQRTDNWNEATHSSVPNDNPLTLLAACLVNESNKEELFDKKYLPGCEAWHDGRLPPDMDH